MNFQMKYLTMNRFQIKYCLFFIFISIGIIINAQRPGIPKKPNPPTLVNNYSKEFPNFISPEEQQILEQKLVAFSKETSNQIVVIIIDDLNGYEPWDFATEIGHQWQVGQAKEDNGVVILIKPTGGSGERKTHIAVGRGLEGAIPDLTSNRIVEKELIPNFKEGNFYKGIDDATNVIMQLAKGEINKKDYDKEEGLGLLGSIFLIFFILMFVIAFFGKNKGGGGGGLGRAITYGAASSMFSGGRSSGSSGFGGFGGGSFGGGGSGGSW
jgi:uncharacterized protein